MRRGRVFDGPAQLFALAMLVLAGGWPAGAEPMPAACSPANCTIPPEPRDGACRHPALLTDKSGTHYEGDRFSPADEAVCIAITHSKASRRGGELHLSFDNGISKVYKDNQSKAACEGGAYESCRKYVLYDYFPARGLLLLHLQFSESGQWFLINQRDGREEQIVAPPAYSPNRKWLASVYWTDGPDDGNNGLDIVRADFSANEPAFHYRPTDYELWEFVGWDGDDRLLLKVTWRMANSPALVTWPAEAVRQNGRWQLNRWPPTTPSVPGPTRP